MRTASQVTEVIVRARSDGRIAASLTGGRVQNRSPRMDDRKGVYNAKLKRGEVGGTVATQQ